MIIVSDKEQLTRVSPSPDTVKQTTMDDNRVVGPSCWEAHIERLNNMRLDMSGSSYLLLKKSWGDGPSKLEPVFVCLQLG